MQFAGHRRGVELVARRGIHRALVEVGDLLVVAAEVRLLGQVLDQGLQLQFRQVGQLVERSVARLVARDDQVLDRRAIGIFEEVVARLDGGVHAGRVEAPGAVGLAERRHLVGIALFRRLRGCGGFRHQRQAVDVIAGGDGVRRRNTKTGGGDEGKGGGQQERAAKGHENPRLGDGRVLRPRLMGRE